MSKTQTKSIAQPTLERLRGWFADRGWSPHGFQEEAWSLHAQGRSGLILVPTGSGKTYAAYLGPLAELADGMGEAGARRGLSIVYISPLRALSRDIELALRAPVDALDLPLTVESRTGDTSSTVRNRQRRTLPNVLVTTPESLCLLLTNADAEKKFSDLKVVIVDEWHELLSSKRGSQIELALARLRRFAPGLRTWGLSATIANAPEAAATLTGSDSNPAIVRAPIDRPVVVRSIKPRDIRRFPWAGHMGLAMLEEVLDDLDPSVPTLVFTNTRSQAEKWFNAISVSRPQWEGRIALHHGSIDREERERVEQGVKAGGIGIVVCTSSLDLGVDFAPVERVIQIGSPKGVARLMQRAGRARHRPNEPCEVSCVPTNALELLEVAAVREEDFARRGVDMLMGARAESIERVSPDGALDPTGGRVIVKCNDGRQIESSHAVLAIGSIPNTDDLGLEAAGVKVDDWGYVGVNHHCVTNVPHIYAAGDISGKLPLSSVASVQGRKVAEHAMGLHTRSHRHLDYDKAASAIFTEPEIADVGLAEAEAFAEGRKIRVTKVPFSATAKAMINADTRGFVKIISDPATGVILGGSIVGRHAAELISVIAVAVTAGLTVTDIVESILVHPALSEALAEAAE